jgi:hypothetical protein
MSVEHQAPRNIAAHAAQSNNPELHVLMLPTTNKMCVKGYSPTRLMRLVQSVGVKFPGIVPDPDG